VTQPFLHPAEHVMISCQHPSSSFCHFIATDCTVLMMDERYPGYPVCIALTSRWLHLSLHSKGSLLLSLLDELCAWCRAGFNERGALAEFRCHSEHGVQAYNGGLGPEPPGRRSGSKPPKAECLLYFACPKLTANLPHYWYLAKWLNHTVNERLIV